MEKKYKKNLNNIISKKSNFLKKFGYISLGDNFFSAEEINLLAKECRKTYKEKKLEDHKDCLSKEGGFEGLKFINQYNKIIHDLLNKFFEKDEIKLFLENILGEFKIWTINYRIASNKDDGLSMHQDSYGETNLSILLENNPYGNGSTNFIPGSHLINTSLKIKIPLILSKFIRPFYKVNKGKRGQVTVFFNKTWHGRESNFSNKNFDAILISIFPPGCSYGSLEYGTWDKQYLETTSKSYLSKILNPEINTTKIGKNKFKINNTSTKTSFTKNLYDKKISYYSFSFFKSIFIVYSLFIISNMLKPLKSILKKEKQNV